MNQLKAFFSSKTVWTQIIAFAAMLAAMFGVEIAVEDQAAIAAGIMGAVNVVSIIVRYMTKSSMGEKAARIEKAKSVDDAGSG